VSDHIKSAMRSCKIPTNELKTRQIRSLSVLILLLWNIIFSLVNAYAQQPAGMEYKVKAGFIYNFATFTEWLPDAFKDSSNLMNLCVAPDKNTVDSVFSDIASTLNEKSVGGKKIILKKCENKDDVKDCHILFIVSKDTEFVHERLDCTKNLNILTVGEAEYFTEMGGMINFFKEKKGIPFLSEKESLRFEVNVDEAERAKLKFRSTLLMSAKIFREEVK